MADLLLPLGDAPGAPTHPSEPITRSALIEGDYRFWLKRAWGPGPAIAWVGLNPSTADGKTDDPTMRAEIGFSFRWGYGSLVKVNLYPFRSSSPKHLANWRGAMRAALGASVGPVPAVGAFYRNWDIAAAEIRKCDLVVAAWGDGADESDVTAFICHVEGGDPTSQCESGPYARDWHCLARTSAGAPRHTLARGKHFIPRDAKPIIYQPRPQS
jgi:hypothetical protein